MIEIQTEEGTQENPTIEQFYAGTVEFSALSEADQETALQKEGGEQVEETPAEEQKAEVVEKPEEPQDELSILKKRHYEKSNELNTFVQVQRNHEKRLKEDPIYRKEWLTQIGIQEKELQKAEDSDAVDVYDENYLRQIESLKREVSELRQSRVSEMEQAKQQQQFDGIFREIEGLQAEVPALKTSMNVRELNELFKQAHMNGNATAEAMAQMGVSREDFDKLSVILSVHGKRESYPSLRAAFRDSEHFDNLQRSTVSAVTQASQQALANKMQEVGNRPHVVDSTSGVVGVQQGGWTEERLRSYFKSNPDISKFGGNQALIDEYRSAMKAAGID